MQHEAFEAMSSQQKSAISKVQRAISECNTAIKEAADAGVEIKINMIPIDTIGRPTRFNRLTARVAFQDFTIA